MAGLAQRRIQSELKTFLRTPPEGCVLERYEDPYCWQIRLQGVGGPMNLYQNQVFRLRVTFSEAYPLEPPEVIFLNPVPVSPHIYKIGHICLSVLYDSPNAGYSPAMTVASLCLSIRSMLASNTEYRRPEGDEEYCRRSYGKSPKATRWEFHDDAA